MAYISFRKTKAFKFKDVILIMSLVRIVFVLIVVLIVVGLLSGNIGFNGFLSKVGGWMEGSPFGGFLSTTEESKNLDMTLYSDISLKPDLPVNISSDSMSMDDFDGEINIDLEGKSVSLSEANSKLKMNIELGKLDIRGLKLSKLVLKNRKLDLKNGDWDIKTDNGTVEIYNFVGSVVVDENINFKGNATKIVRG